MTDLDRPSPDPTRRYWIAVSVPAAQVDADLPDALAYAADRAETALQEERGYEATAWRADEPSAGGHTDRRDKYATAISRWHRDPEQPLYTQGAEAVMAVADAEQAELRAELERLRSSRWDATKVVADLESRLHATHAVLEGQATPPTDRAALRDRIAAAMYEAEYPGYDWAQAHEEDREQALQLADAVLAVLPEAADRAAVRVALAAAADRLSELRAAEREWLPATGLHKGEQELRRMADETATEHRPAVSRWRVETLDNLAGEWAPGTGWPVRALAVERFDAMNAQAPRWKDGTPVTRRLVRETTTYTVEAETGPDAGARQDEPPTPSLRDQHRAAWHALTPDQQTARIAELDEPAAGARQDGAES